MKKYTNIDASPVKRFFVEMLTRDIELEDAILDLLDNCIDGILRSQPDDSDPEKPYKGYWAKVTFNQREFEIEDNCGGIPWDLHEKAFRMGRPRTENGTEDKGSQLTVGVYGIGMKRAIFKMGSDALIWTQNNKDNYSVAFSPSWMTDEESWELEVKPEREKMKEDGTHIVIQDLHQNVIDRFAAESFQDGLIDKIASHYAVIIHKGFGVQVNKVKAEPKPIEFRFDEGKRDGKEIRPYIFKGEFDGVDVFLAVGLREPIPGIEKTLEEQEGVVFSSEYAGWTVICNDRVVTYCNRDELTGWGTARLPRYHTQFIAISGVVEFRGDPIKLPTTTTKRNLNFSSSLYQQVLDRMREGTRLFVDFTNKWKTREDEAKSIVSPVPAISFSEVKSKSEKLAFSETRVGLKGSQYMPKLPMPPSDTTDVRISYIRHKKQVQKLAEKLLPDFEETREKDIPRKVGEESFDFAYKQLIGKK